MITRSPMTTRQSSTFRTSSPNRINNPMSFSRSQTNPKLHSQSNDRPRSAGISSNRYMRTSNSPNRSTDRMRLSHSHSHTNTKPFFQSSLNKSMNRSTDRSLSPAHSSNRYLHVGRSSKNKVPTVSFGGKSRSIHKTDNRKTEHEASFVEWEPATQMPFKPDRLTNPISLSEDEMDVSRWISEQKRLIGLDTSTGANQPGMKPAGKKYSSDYHYPTSFAWDKENIHSNVQDPDYARGEAKLNTYNDLYQYDTSEHDQQFKWRATDRVVSAAPVAKGSPIVLNYDNANDGGMLSEYDRQCMDLRNKQQQLLGSEPEPVAGITYEKNEKLPMSLNYEDQQPQQSAYNAFYGSADSGDESPRPNKAPASIPYEYNPISETRQKFPEYPFDAYAHPLQETRRANTLNLFRIDPTDGDIPAGNELNRTSEYAEEYKTPTSSEGLRAHMPNRQGKFPKQFAWPVMDGIPVPPPKVEDTDRPTLRGLDSEYDSRYKWKVSTPDHKIKNRKVGRDEQVANPNGLFDGPDMNARGWMSEYDQQCAELRQQQNSLLSNPVAGIPSNRSGLIPAYYAWPETKQPELPSKKPEPGVELPHSEYRDNYPDKSTFIDPQSHVPRRKDELNLFEREPDAPTSEQKLSEYDKEYQQPIGKPLNAFDQKIIDSLVSNNKDSRPPQFAWPRVDPIVEKPKPTPIPGIPRDPSEYDRAYTWREADRVRPVKPRDSNPFALDEGDKDASKWVSEHDEKEDAAVDASHKAILPAAGKPLNVVKKEDNPTFYAWPPEAPKPVPRKVFVDREIVHSEYEDNFRPKTPERTRPAKIVNQLNLFSTDPDNNLQSFEPIESEYDRNFEPPSRSESPDPIEKIANKNLVERPPMFAWGLAEGPKENTEPYVIPSGIEPTEYDSKFSWPKNVQVNRSAQGSWQTSTPNGPIAGNGKDAKLWKSEYDQKCEEFRAKQQQVDETNKITAGKEVPHDPEAPANFAWKPSENSRPPVQLNSAIPFDDSTEYGDHFLSWPLPPAPIVPKNRQDISKILSQDNSRTFVGESEYDANFQNTIDTKAATLNRVKPDRFAHTLQSTNLEQTFITPNTRMHQPAPRNEVVSSVFSDAGDVSQIQSSIPSPTVRSRSATFTGTTEQRENYTWPDSTTAAKSTPVLNSNKSKLMFGVNPPKVRSVWKENDRRKLMGAFANPVNAKKMSLTQTRFPSSTGSPYFHSNVYRNRGASPAHRFGTSYAANRGVNKNLVDARNHRGSRPNSAKDSSTRSEQEKPTTDTAFSADSLAVVPVANGTTTTITDVDAASNFDTITTPATGKNTNYSKQYGDQYSVGSNSLNDSYAQSAGTGDNVLRRDFKANHSASTIGLRDYEGTYRARSAPPRPRLTSTYADTSSKAPYYIDETPSNPVLFHRRYPAVSDKQKGRWSTETADSFRGFQTNSPLRRTTRM